MMAHSLFQALITHDSAALSLVIENCLETKVVHYKQDIWKLSGEAYVKGSALFGRLLSARSRVHPVDKLMLICARIAAGVHIGHGLGLGRMLKLVKVRIGTCCH